LLHPESARESPRRLEVLVREHAVPVLLYHGIGRTSVPELARFEISAGGFADHMRHLAREGYAVIRLAEYAAFLRDPVNVVLPDRPVVITFDDGYANFADAAEVLADFGFPSTLFVATAYVGGTNSWLPGRAGTQPMLGWDKIAHVRSLGVEIGAHSHEHVPLDEFPPATVRAQVDRSRATLEDQLGVAMDAFAYPFGYHDGTVTSAVQESGFRYACAVKDSLSTPEDGAFAIARLFAPTTGDAESFERLLTHGTRRRRRHERVTTKAWRTVRRARRHLGQPRGRDVLSSPRA
jgi:peptidoglycan/xylan/chitin deacetylase (PgdA/CDA1 family)